MYRYIITREKLEGREYSILALYDESGKMVEVLPEPLGEASILGNIYIGRVETVARNLDAAFVRIAPGRNCYLPLAELKSPIFTRKLSGKKELAVGDELLVQIVKEPVKTKEAVATANLSFTGRYAALTTGNLTFGVSAKLPKERREHYMKLLEGLRGGMPANGGQKAVDGREDADSRKPGGTEAHGGAESPGVPAGRAECQKEEGAEGLGAPAGWAGGGMPAGMPVVNGQEFGIVIRTNATNVPDGLVTEEIAALRQRCTRLLAEARHKTCCSLICRAPAPYLKHLNDIRQDLLDEIVTDDREIFKELCAAYRIPEERLMTGGSVSVPVNLVETGEGIRIRHYADKSPSLSVLYSIGYGLKEALKERVWLKSGAYLVIQPTEALTVIDVNTGKNTAKKDAQENFLRVNKEAAAEIARQIRLRNISGIILVDFVNLTSREAEGELLSAFGAALREDPVPTRLVDMTKLGLAEVTRKKVRRPLWECLRVGAPQK